jgi:DNA-binding Lrp family transcriptional regulator
MPQKISSLDRKIIRLLASDIPLVDRPFKRMGEKIGISEEEILQRIRYYKNKGIMRKYTAILNHRKAGFLYNAMVVWDIPKDKLEKAGKIVASFSQVSHCYLRERLDKWRYNLYAMIHARSRKSCLEIAKKICKKIKNKNCKVLFSRKEYKKSQVIF